MVLCFGILAKILKCCNKGLSQVRFVPKIAWVVDPKNSCLEENLLYEVTDDVLDTMPGNPTLVTKLLRCKNIFKIKSEYLPSVPVARTRFKDKVLPLIDPQKIGRAILAILYVISKDETIVTKHKVNFRKYIGMDKDELLQQERFNVPDFLARILLYTTYVDNTEGEEITEAFIEKAVKDSWVETEWDDAKQTLKIIPIEEKRLWDEINRINDLRFSLMGSENNSANMSWLGVDKRILFPSEYNLEIKNPETKRMLTIKIGQYTKLVHEFVGCLVTYHQSGMGRSARYPVFPDEKMRNIRQQMMNLGDEIEKALLKASLGF